MNNRQYLAHGQTLYAERYQVIRLLGVGGAAAVYQVYDSLLNTHRAIKMLLPPKHGGQNTRQRFEQEAILVAGLEHPNIVTVHDLFTENERLHLVMELCQSSLADWVQCNGPVPVDLAIHACCQLLEALSAAHDAGVIHRDVKPHNLLIGRSGFLKLSDFGIAQFVDDQSANTATGEILGSLAFMAPEQRLNASEVGPPADLFSAAATLLWMTTTKLLVDMWMSDEPSTVFADLPNPLVAIIRRGLATQPDNRYQSAQEFIQALRHHIPNTTGLTFRNIEGSPSGSVFDTHIDTTPASLHDRSTNVTRTFRWGWLPMLLVLGSITISTWQGFRQSPPAQELPTNELASLRHCKQQAPQFSRKGTNLSGRESIAARFFDLDKDKNTDAVVVNRLDKNLGIFWADIAGIIGKKAQLIDCGASSSAPAIGDLNKDGWPDLILALDNGQGFNLIRGVAERDFAAPELVAETGPIAFPELLDWNNDGTLDLAFVRGSELLLRLGNGNGFAPGLVVASQETPYTGLSAGDLNADGKPELVTASKDEVHVHSATPEQPLQRFTLHDFVVVPGAPNFRGRNLDVLVRELEPKIAGAEIYAFFRENGPGIIRVTQDTPACIYSYQPLSAAGDVFSFSDLGFADPNSIPDLLQANSCSGCTGALILSLGIPKQSSGVPLIEVQ